MVAVTEIRLQLEVFADRHALGADVGRRARRAGRDATYAQMSSSGVTVVAGLVEAGPQISCSRPRRGRSARGQL